MGDEGLQETLNELEANIKSELTGESSETRSRKKRYIQYGSSVADEHSSYMYEEYPTYNIDAYEVQPPLYGFLSSKKVQYEHRVKRGLPSWGNVGLIIVTQEGIRKLLTNVYKIWSIRIADTKTLIS